MQLNAVAENINKAAANADLYPELSKPDIQFDPNLYQGKIVVTTFHKAKGLEWDQVYLTAVITMNFLLEAVIRREAIVNTSGPSSFIFAINWIFKRNHWSSFAYYLMPNPPKFIGKEKAVFNPINSIVSERLRLLYVGITRAKKGLHIFMEFGTFRTGTGSFGNKISAGMFRGKKEMKLISQSQIRDFQTCPQKYI